MFVHGKYVPASYKECKYEDLKEDNYLNVANEIMNQKYKQICLNDVDSNIDFEKMKKEINDAFESILPEKSSFEI